VSDRPFHTPTLPLGPSLVGGAAFPDLEISLWLTEVYFFSRWAYKFKRDVFRFFASAEDASHPTSFTCTRQTVMFPASLPSWQVLIILARLLWRCNCLMFLFSPGSKTIWAKLSGPLMDRVILRSSSQAAEGDYDSQPGGIGTGAAASAVST